MAFSYWSRLAAFGSLLLSLASCSLEPVRDSNQMGLVPALMVERALKDKSANSYLEAVVGCDQQLFDSLVGEKPDFTALLDYQSQDLMAILVKKGCQDFIRELLKYGVPRSAHTRILRAAIESGRLDVLDLFQEQSIPIQFRDDEGKTALIYAVEWGDYDMVKKLIELGVARNQTDYSGKTALDVALKRPNKGKLPNSDTQYRDIQLLLKGDGL